MSNPVIALAESIASASPRNGDATERLADALLEANRDALYWATKYSALYKQFNAAIHERDELRERLGRTVYARTEPKYSRLCANTECSTSIVRDEPPPDEFVEQWLKGLGWSPDYCPRCKP